MLDMPTKLGLEFGGLCVLAKTERCEKCGRHIGRERAIFESIDKPIRPFPLFLTSDGFFVVSKRFRDFVVGHGFHGVEFVLLANRYFVMKVARCVAYDLSRMKVTQKNFCSECESYESNLVALAPRAIVADEAPIAPLEIVESAQRWGVEVGQNTAQHPDLLVGDAGWKLIKAEGFRGIDFRETI